MIVYLPTKIRKVVSVSDMSVGEREEALSCSIWEMKWNFLVTGKFSVLCDKVSEREETISNKHHLSISFMGFPLFLSSPEGTILGNSEKNVLPWMFPAPAFSLIITNLNRHWVKMQRSNSSSIHHDKPPGQVGHWIKDIQKTQGTPMNGCLGGGRRILSSSSFTSTPIWYYLMKNCKCF